MCVREREPGILTTPTPDIRTIALLSQPTAKSFRKPSPETPSPPQFYFCRSHAQLAALRTQTRTEFCVCFCCCFACDFIFIFQGGMVHRDSMGLKQRYGANAVQWMSAGRGILHEEMWDIKDKWEKADMELYQIWVRSPLSRACCRAVRCCLFLFFLLALMVCSRDWRRFVCYLSQLFGRRCCLSVQSSGRTTRGHTGVFFSTFLLRCLPLPRWHVDFVHLGSCCCCCCHCCAWARGGGVLHLFC